MSHDSKDSPVPFHKEIPFVEGDFQKFCADRVSGSSEFPDGRFGPYEKLEFLGQGGMARVYKAFDPVLGREIALKFLLVDEPSLTARLLLEAQAQARIDHLHVCRVYEAGELEGRPYIAMQYVRGRSLLDLREQLTIEQKLLAIRDVAEGVHAAHRAGIIHRDLKPSNILLESSERQQWISYVMDFGLARDLSSPGITKTGVVVGSPLYMAPEQAFGLASQVDRRCDVYSLGVTLYQTLSGKLPMEGSTDVEVLVKAFQDEVVLLRTRNPEIPRDVETIVMKCLEKEPARRYQSAKALAEDIDRYLEGEPIQARPVSLIRKIGKKLRKHKGLMATATVALLITIIFGWISWNTRRQAQEQVMIAGQFGKQIQQIESVMRIAYMLPLHDTRQEKQVVRKRSDSIRKQMKLVGSLGYGPGHYAIGRCYLALKDYEKAQDHLQMAWQSGYHEAEVAYSLGLVLGKLYQEKMQAAQRLSNQILRDKEIQQIEKTIREDALTYLASSKGVWGEAPTYVEALLSFYEKKYPEALVKANESFKAYPWLYEAKQLQGDAYLLMGDDKLNHGNLTGAEKDYETAGQLYAAASEIAKSDASIYKSNTQRLGQLLYLKRQRGENVSDVYRAALDSINKALLASPDDSDAHIAKSWLHIRWAESISEVGNDPNEPRNLAIHSSQEALRWNPKDIDAYETLGMSYWRKGEYENDHGQDPRASLSRAIEFSDKLLQSKPNYVWAFNNSGLAHWTKGNYELQHGIDPRTSLHSAIEDFQQAIQASPNYIWPHTNVGNAYTHLAHYEIRKGMDPLHSLNHAIASYREALKLNPTFAVGHNNLGSAYHFRAIYEISQDLDSADSLNQAATAYRKAFELKPDYIWPYNNLAQICALESTKQLEKGVDPSKTLEEGRSAIARALEISDSYSLIYQTKGEVEIAAARWAIREKKIPDPYFRNAEQSLRLALQKDETNLEAIVDSIVLFRWMAEWNLSRGADPSVPIKDGLRYADAALKIDPQIADASALMGRLLFMKARISRDPKPYLVLAQSALIKALKANKNLEQEYWPILKEVESLLLKREQP
ncbi:protein kinase [bacterium]|nr:protein kinase [bacterium]